MEGDHAAPDFFVCIFVCERKASLASAPPAAANQASKLRTPSNHKGNQILFSRLCLINKEVFLCSVSMNSLTHAVGIVEDTKL